MFIAAEYRPPKDFELATASQNRFVLSPLDANEAVLFNNFTPTQFLLGVCLFRLQSHWSGRRIELGRHRHAPVWALRVVPAGFLEVISRTRP